MTNDGATSEQSDLREAVTYIQNIASASPEFGDKWTVIAVERIGERTVVLDLDDGTTIRLDIERYPYG